MGVCILRVVQYQKTFIHTILTKAPTPPRDNKEYSYNLFWTATKKLYFSKLVSVITNGGKLRKSNMIQGVQSIKSWTNYKGIYIHNIHRISILEHVHCWWHRQYRDFYSISVQILANISPTINWIVSWSQCFHIRDKYIIKQCILHNSKKVHLISGERGGKVWLASPFFAQHVEISPFEARLR